MVAHPPNVITAMIVMARRTALRCATAARHSARHLSRMQIPLTVALAALDFAHHPEELGLDAGAYQRHRDERRQHAVGLDDAVPVQDVPVRRAVGLDPVTSVELL